MARRTAGGVGALAAAAEPVSESLGWAGEVLPPLRVLGDWLVPVVRLDQESHLVRVAGGDGPQLDQDVLAIWEWPESEGHAPRTVVDLVGVLVWATSWRSGLGTGQGWRGFGPVAVVGPQKLADDLGQIGKLEFAVSGVGLVEYISPQQARMVLSAASGRVATARRRVLDRWVEETLYGHALDVGILTR